MAKKTKRGKPVSKKSSKPVSVKLPRNYESPADWLLPMMEEAYSLIKPKEEMEADAGEVPPSAATKRLGAGRTRPAAAVKGKKGRRVFVSTYQANQGEEVLAKVPHSYWHDRFAEFQRRRTEAFRRRRAAEEAHPAGVVVPPMPAIAGQNNWTPLGPSIVAHAQTGNRAPISGRVVGIAVAPGGLRVYSATADGGVWRSDDAGNSWRSTMDSFDENPNNFASTSLACGAIAIDPANPDRVYVGTGEGETDAIFSNRITSALPTYRGIGPIRSDDGGNTWALETSTPSLAGFAFYQIAVDPADPNHCVAATTNGLYERVPSGAVFEWQRRRTGSHSSVVVARAAGVTNWFAAQFGGSVFRSTDGTTWAAIGTGIPAGMGRIALGAQRDNPNVVYAVIANTNGVSDSVRRLDGMAGAWKNITGVPTFLPVINGRSQGDYDLCISVDPNNANLIYLGGSFDNVSPFPGSIWRCPISPSGSAYSMTGTSIGRNAHADVHVLMHAPADSNTLWTGTDGGMFVNLNPTGADGFLHRNTGLNTLCPTFLGQHPTEPAVMFVGLQDNGTAKCVGEEMWRHVLTGDGGYCIVNWNDPFRILLYANGSVFRATDGALDWGSWTDVTPSGAAWLVMAAPLVTTPINVAAPAEANVVAYAAGTVNASGFITAINIYISADFGTTWPTVLALPLAAATGLVFSMVFASSSRLFVGTTTGRVFRVDKVAGAWTAPVRIDNAGATPLPVAALITDIAVDWSDASLNSIFISLGGTGDFRHVWRFNGTTWQARSGTAGSGTELIDVEHNAIQYDRVTNHLYVGADIGAWESADAGGTWNALSNGLPDAPVYDLQIHPTARLLRAALHGRGVWEWKLDAPALPDVELYVRDTLLDTGRGVNTDGRNDPSIFPTAPVLHYLSPNIKVDVPTPLGYQTPTNAIDFYTFNEVIQDGSGGVGTNSPPPTVHNRLYVEVHNRGRTDAASVQVMAAITNAGTGLALPAGYTANVVAGTPLPGPKWITLGVQTLSNLRAGFPQIAAFDIPSTVLPMPASLPGNDHWCTLAFVHSAQDPFTSAVGNADALTLADRKVGQKNLHIVQFIGVPPAPASGIGMWAMLIISGAHFKEKGLIDLVIDSRRFPGDIHLVLPPPLFPKSLEQQVKGLGKGSAALVKRWQDSYTATAKRLFFEAKYSEYQYGVLVNAMKTVAGQTPLVLKGRATGEIRQLPIGPKDEFAVFLRVDPPRGTKIGSVFEFDIVERDSKSQRALGGSRYRVVVNKPAK